MKSVELEINGVKVTAFEDGSIAKVDGRFKDGRVKRTFGSNDGRGYLNVGIGYKMLKVHRIIAQAFFPDFLDLPQVDHIDNNRLNNNVTNLRMVSNQTNLRAGRRKAKGRSSRYFGVHWNKEKGKWVANATSNNNCKFLGYYDNERDAAIARDTYAFSQGFLREGMNFPENYR
tara:strand:+ start:184 stop:702 length:519 start_codon:yes stop_codon:yes gene_type:complete